MTADTQADMRTPVAGAAASALERFRAIVLADPGLQLELAQPYDPADFAGLAARRARERGVALSAEAIGREARPDPLGVSRWDAQATLIEDWPAGDWLPVHIGGSATPYIEWAQFAGAPLTEPFFEESRRRAASLPFNAVFRRRTALADFIAAATPDRARAPTGLIFHMSRCGSTLVAQMLAAAPRNTVISEAPPLDAAVQLEAFGAPPGRYAGVLAAMVGALGRRQPAAGTRLFFKHDSWHAMSLPLFRRSFPSTPWVFLYRDPVEVIVSQARQAGMQTVPGLLPREIVGIDPAGMPPDAYGAAVLGRTCEAAADAFALGGGLLVNHSELPGAFYWRVLPHFGVTADADELAAMIRVARQDAKASYAAFTPDGEAKRAEATPRMLDLVSRHMAAPYRRLEALRIGRPPP
jgi:hypothetical protein